MAIILSNKYAKLVTTHGTLYDDRVVWIKLECIGGGNLGVACVYALNIPMDQRHLCHNMTYFIT